MKQYHFENNQLTLYVKTSPLLVRVFMFMFSFLFFILPIAGMIGYASSGKGIHFGFFAGIFIFSLLGFYLLRLALWNTYGKEELKFSNKTVTYYADYGWFKDAMKTVDLDSLSFSIQSVGYEEDKKGVLIIGEDENTVECVTKMPISELKKLITELELKF
jgi:hypothetical protein